MTDGELLRRYARDHSEDCFTELVRRHINLIYSAALRQVNHDPHLAEEVLQSVFTDLARKAAKLAGHPSLTGWLYTSARFAATNLRRADHRRQLREQEALAMNSLLNTSEPAPDWDRIRPLLDEAMHTLSEPDRQAVLLRHFENRSYADIGACLGLSEDTARKRVERALEKLHGVLARQGVTGTTATMAGLLAAHAVGIAPAPLAARVARTALKGVATAGGVSVLVSQLFASAKTKLALGAVAAVIATTLILVATSHHASAGNSPGDTAPPAPTNPRPVIVTASAAAAPVPMVAALPARAKPKETNGLVLHLAIITADTGKPIPLVPIDYRGWTGRKFKGKKLMSDRFGVCDVVYPTNTTELELTTRKDDFADTQLLWRPPNGEIIPANYLLRVDRSVAIGGTVVDPNGQPVAGAQVGWNHNDDPTAKTLPQNHEFGWIETTTDADGHWRINRMADDMIPRVYGSASDSNYVGSAMVFAGRDKTVEQQLRAGTLVFKLGRAVTAKGLVTAADGTPIAGADIGMGYRSMSGHRTGKTLEDGTFSVAGCQPGKQIVTAEYPGFAATTVEADVEADSEPVHLVLNPGKTLRLRVVDAAGNPVPRASIHYNNMDQGRVDPQRPKSVQIEYNATTDREGRAVLTNAPDADMKLQVRGPGSAHGTDLTVHPDDEEHLVTLTTGNPVVHGVVWDAATGNRIPKFRIVEGWPEENPIEGTTTARWSTLDRFWLNFSGGTYQQSLDEPVIAGMENPGFILKFMAEGHAPFISRVIKPNEGDVELNVSLQRADDIKVTVNNPDGRPAAAADIGLVSPGARLNLIQGGFARVNVQTGGSLLRTAADGTFILSPDDAVIRVIAATPDGYAESTPAALAANPVLQLQPGGNLTVSCVAGGQSGAGLAYAVEFGGESRDSIDFDLSMSHATTDAQGQFSITNLPPGHHQLTRIYPFKSANGGGGWSYGDKVGFDIQPGETTTLNPWANTYAISARWQWPAGMQRQPDWQIKAQMSMAMPPIPPEIATNQATRAAFMQSDEFKAARQNSHRYQGTVNADDSLSVDGVQPGDYALTISVLKVIDPSAPGADIGFGPGVENEAYGSVPISVPADPPAGNLDAGTIQLQAVPMRR